MGILEAGRILQQAQASGQTPEDFVMAIFERQQPPHRAAKTATELGVHISAVYYWLARAKKEKEKTPA